jgi:hypothetical protein
MWKCEPMVFFCWVGGKNSNSSRQSALMSNRWSRLRDFHFAPFFFSDRKFFDFFGKLTGNRFLMVVPHGLCCSGMFGWRAHTVFFE